MMAEMADSIYPQLEKALNLLIESSAKIEFLYGKVENKLRDLSDEEMARIAQRSIFLEEDLDVAALDDNTAWKSVKEKADNLQRSLIACGEKCTDLQGRIRELIDMKDTLFCQAMTEQPLPCTELLPKGTRIDRMTMELKVETTECSICTENVKKQQQIWSCKSCYNIFHLECAGKCMEATKRNGKWACPYCRVELNATAESLRYTCFCERVIQPKSALNVTPHGCGQSCKRGCGKICHPGPCANSNPLPQPAGRLSSLPV